MTSSNTLMQKDFCWQSIWNRGLVSLFIIMFFFDNITRYKHIVGGLMLITALYYVAKKRSALLQIFKNNLTFNRRQSQSTGNIFGWGV